MEGGSSVEGGWMAWRGGGWHGGGMEGGREERRHGGGEWQVRMAWGMA